MADSWEEIDDIGNDQAGPETTQKKPALNPNASSFSFNPTASAFVPPSFAPPPPPPRPAPPAAQPPPPPTAASPEPAAETKTQTDDALSNGVTVSEAAAEAHDDSNDNGASADAAAAGVQSMSISDSAAPAQAPEEEEEEEEDLNANEEERRKVVEKLRQQDSREHLNVVFIGHVDAGKSTLGGQILYLTGAVDERTIQKYEKEARDKAGESWYMAYIMDTNDEERAKGKTVEVGRACFSTEKKRYTILDAPGHKTFVPNMISGATQADVAVLVIAARKGEFETGFERGGQTREHTQLIKTAGVHKLIIAVNKMDDPSIVGPNGTWNQQRFEEIKEGLMPFMRSSGFKKEDLIFLPVAGLQGHNVKTRVPDTVCSWYKGPCLFEVLDGLEPIERDPMAPFRMPVIDRYKDMGCVVMGRSESGFVQTGSRLMLMPGRTKVEVAAVYRDDDEVDAAGPGENLKLRLTGVDEENIMQGFVLCSVWEPVPVVSKFEAQLRVLDLLEHNPVFTAGYRCVLHIHATAEECEVEALLFEMNMKTKQQKRVKFVKSNAVVTARLTVDKPVCMEVFDRVPQLGRFTLRDEGRTIAVGKVTKLPKSRS